MLADTSLSLEFSQVFIISRTNEQLANGKDLKFFEGNLIETMGYYNKSLRILIVKHEIRCRSLTTLDKVGQYGAKFENIIK